MNSAQSSPRESLAFPRHSAAGAAEDDDADAHSSLEWTVVLRHEQPGKLIAITFALGLVLLCSLSIFHSLLAGLVGCALTIGVLKEFLAPLHFRLTDELASVTCGGIPWVEMRWDHVRRAYRTPAGLKLSPYLHPESARTEQLRGMTLRFPRAMMPAVEEFVGRKVDISHLQDIGA